MTGQLLSQNFKCPVIGKKRPVMTDDRMLFPALHGTNELAICIFVCIFQGGFVAGDQKEQTCEWLIHLV